MRCLCPRPRTLPKASVTAVAKGALEGVAGSKLSGDHGTRECPPRRRADCARSGPGRSGGTRPARRPKWRSTRSGPRAANGTRVKAGEGAIRRGRQPICSWGGGRATRAGTLGPAGRRADRAPPVSVWRCSRRELGDARKTFEVLRTKGRLVSREHSSASEPGPPVPATTSRRTASRRLWQAAKPPTLLARLWAAVRSASLLETWRRIVSRRRSSPPSRTWRRGHAPRPRTPSRKSR